MNEEYGLVVGLRVVHNHVHASAAKWNTFRLTRVFKMSTITTPVAHRRRRVDKYVLLLHHDAAGREFERRGITIDAATSLSRISEGLYGIRTALTAAGA